MICVFEGPNGAGKSTLIAELVVRRSTPSVVIHNGPSTTPLDDYTGQLRQALADSREGISTFIDRFNFGEQVYPVLYGREGLIDEVQDELIVQIGASLGVHWFVLCPPVKRLAEGLSAKAETYDFLILAKERDRFIEVAEHHQKRWPSNVHIYYVDHPVEHLVKSVENVMKYARPAR